MRIKDFIRRNVVATANRVADIVASVGIGVGGVVCATGICRFKTFAVVAVEAKGLGEGVVSPAGHAVVGLLGGNEADTDGSISVWEKKFSHFLGTRRLFVLMRPMI